MLHAEIESSFLKLKSTIEGLENANKEKEATIANLQAQLEQAKLDSVIRALFLDNRNAKIYLITRVGRSNDECQRGCEPKVGRM